MKSESKSLFVTASAIFVKSRKRRVAKEDGLTLSFIKVQLAISKISVGRSLRRGRYNYLQLLFYAG